MGLDIPEKFCSEVEIIETKDGITTRTFTIYDRSYDITIIFEDVLDEKTNMTIKRTLKNWYHGDPCALTVLYYRERKDLEADLSDLKLT